MADVVEEAVERLAAACREAGVPEPAPPKQPPDLDAVDQAIAPLRLPAQMRRLWELDGPHIHAASHPTLMPPDFGLKTWVRARRRVSGDDPTRSAPQGNSTATKRWAPRGCERALSSSRTTRTPRSKPTNSSGQATGARQSRRRGASKGQPGPL